MPRATALDFLCFFRPPKVFSSVKGECGSPGKLETFSACRGLPHWIFVFFPAQKSFQLCKKGDVVVRASWKRFQLAEGYRIGFLCFSGPHKFSFVSVLWGVLLARVAYTERPQDPGGTVAPPDWATEASWRVNTKIPPAGLLGPWVPCEHLHGFHVSTSMGSM